MCLDLDDLFKPKNIAVIGATSKSTWGWDSGNSWIAGAMKQGFQGAIYPVHPKAKNILGLKVYPTILDVPDVIDLAIFTVPIKAVISIMNQCVEKSVKYVHLLTAGFTETGRAQDANIEKELVDIANKGGIRLIGPNCMGIYSPQHGISFSDAMPMESGNLGLISQRQGKSAAASKQVDDMLGITNGLADGV